MSRIPNALPSPRIICGVLHWYENDTFELQIELELEDQDGEPVIIGENDTVNVTFSNEYGEQVKEFSFSNIQHNTVTLEFDATATALFGKGRYSYDVYLSSNARVTLANDNEVMVT